MLSSSEIERKVVWQIKRVYQHPNMFGNADGVESCLWCYHWCWAMILGKEKDFIDGISLRSTTLQSSTSIAETYRRRNPEMTDDEICDRVLDIWREISKRLGIDIQ